jgi:hypothetical protein
VALDNAADEASAVLAAEALIGYLSGLCQTPFPFSSRVLM